MSLQNKIEFLLFNIFVIISRIIGIKRARYAGVMLAYVFFYIIPIRKNVVFSNIKKAFPNLTQKEIQRIAFGSYKSFAITLFEILCIPYVTKQQIISMMEFSDLEMVRENYKLGKGIIFITAHFGNWELSAISMGVQLNLPVYGLIKPQRNKYVSEWLNNMREKFGNKVIPVGVSVKNMFVELKKKNIIGIVGDQRGPREGIRVNFFNQSTATYPGTAALAIRTKAPVIVAMCVRQNDYKYKVKLMEIDINCITGTEEEKIIKFNQQYMNILEDTIKAHPEQWLWMHNIWKY